MIHHRENVHIVLTALQKYVLVFPFCNQFPVCLLVPILPCQDRESLLLKIKWKKNNYIVVTNTIFVMTDLTVEYLFVGFLNKGY